MAKQRTEGAVVKIGTDIIGGVRSWSFDGGERNVIDTTDLESSVGSFVLGIKQTRQLSLDLDLDLDSEGQREAWAAYNSAAIKTFSITYPSSPEVTFGFSGQVLSFAFSAETDGKFSGTINIRLTTDVTGFPAPTA